MRAKELKEFLNNIPDDTELFIRCQLHETQPIGLKETITIASLTPHINDTSHYVMFNPSKAIRLVSYLPAPTDMVSCETCVRHARISACKKRGKTCEGCTAVCDCKNCGNINVEMLEQYVNKPMYEFDTHAKKKY